MDRRDDLGARVQALQHRAQAIHVLGAHSVHLGDDEHVGELDLFDQQVSDAASVVFCEGEGAILKIVFTGVVCQEMALTPTVLGDETSWFWLANPIALLSFEEHEHDH